MIYSKESVALRWIAFGTLAFLSLSTRVNAIDNLQYDIVDPVVADGHAHLFVQAWSKGGSQSTNVRHYLIDVELNSSGESREVSVGPVLTSADRRLESQPLLEFDRELYGPMPTERIYLSPQGRLLKDVVENNSHLRRWSLYVGSKNASWKDEGLTDRLHLYSSDQIDGYFFKSLPERFIVERGKGTSVGVYDVQVGRRLQDKWLEDAAADFFRRADCRDSHVVLTDDLKFLVMFPRPISDDDKFALDGKRYSKSGHGIVYERGKLTPKVFSGMRGEYPSYVPFDCYSDDGSLRFLAYDEKSLSLRDIDGNIVASRILKTPMDWLNSYGVRVSYDTKRKEVTLNAVPTLRLRPDDEDVSDIFHVLIWHYPDSKIESHEIAANPWFKETDKGFYPVRNIPIEKR